LFAKQDRANIDEVELRVLRSIAKGNASLTPAQVIELVRDGAWIEICDDSLEPETG